MTREAEIEAEEEEEEKAAKTISFPLLDLAEHKMLWLPSRAMN